MPTAHRRQMHTKAAPLAKHSGSLSSVTCLGGLREEARDDAAKACRFISYAAGDIVGGPGAGETSVAFVTHGAVRVSLPPDRHGDVSFFDVSEGGVFGHLEALTGETPKLSAVALSSAEVSFLPASAFCMLIEAHPVIALELMRAHARDTMTQAPRTPGEAGSSSPMLYAELLRMAEADSKMEDGLLISRLPRHRELADWTGLSEAEVAASLASLVKSGCVERRYPGLCILDAERLRKLASGAGTSEK
jgi:CRP-like cAMP-binding protein